MATERRAFLVSYPWARGLFVLVGVLIEAFAAFHVAAPVDLVALGLAVFFVAFL